MGTLKIFTKNDKIVIQRITEFNHATNRHYDTIEDVKAAIMTMPDSVIHDYTIEIEHGIDIGDEFIKAFTMRSGVFQDSPKKDKESPLQ